MDNQREALLVSGSSSDPQHRSKDLFLIGLLLATIPLAIVIGCQEFPGDVAKLLVRAERARELSLGPFEPEPLTRGLSDTDPLVRGISVLSLVNHEPRLVSDFLDRSPATLDAATRAVIAVEALHRHGTEFVAPQARSICRTPQQLSPAPLRQRATEACSAVGWLDSLAVRSLSEDVHWAVRAQLALSLRAHPEIPDSAPVLRKLSGDAHPTVRRAASGMASTSP